MNIALIVGVLISIASALVLIPFLKRTRTSPMAEEKFDVLEGDLSTLKTHVHELRDFVSKSKVKPETSSAASASGPAEVSRT